MFKKILIGGGIIIGVMVAALFFMRERLMWLAFIPTDQTITESIFAETTPPQENEVIAQNLDIPWDIVFLPDGRFLIPERPGTVALIDADTTTRLSIAGVNSTGEGGLLGAVLHPQFEQNNWIYFYLTSSEQGRNINRVERYDFDGTTLSAKTVIIDQIGGAIYHDGGRMAFGPDGYLYITTGDAGTPASAQDTSKLEGKILRITDSGEIPTDNPFGNEVYSYGHRNPQGLAWDDQDRLWSTEHGPSGLQTGFDELNLIVKGGNYGWPNIQGDEKQAGMVEPVIQSGAADTWAPASLAHKDGSLFFGGLRGEALYEYVIATQELKTHFKGEFGRIRAVVVGPDGDLYITTSNRDGRGRVREGDDKVIRVSATEMIAE